MTILRKRNGVIARVVDKVVELTEPQVAKDYRRAVAHAENKLRAEIKKHRKRGRVINDVYRTDPIQWRIWDRYEKGDF